MKWRIFTYLPVNKLFYGKVLLIIILSSCISKKSDQKEEEIKITENLIEIDTLKNSIKGNMTLNQIASNPNSVILTGLKDHRLVTIYKAIDPDNSFVENIGYSKRTTFDYEGNEIEIEKPFMPGIEILYGYNLLNIAHHNLKTGKLNYFFERPVLVKTLYYPSFEQDSLHNIPVNRNYYLLSVYDDDSNKDSIINKRDLRRLYFFDENCDTKKLLIPADYSVIRSQYDSQNDIMYVFAQQDVDKSGSCDKKEPVHIFWIDLKMPHQAKPLY